MVAAAVLVLAVGGWTVSRLWPKKEKGLGSTSVVPNSYYCEKCKQPFMLEAPPKEGEKPVCPSCKAATDRPMYEYLCGRCGKLYKSPLPLDQVPVCPHCNQCDPREPPAQGGGRQK